MRELGFAPGFSEAWLGVQGVRKETAPEDVHRSGAAYALAHLGPDIPWQVASPQSPPPFLRAMVM
jgi:hypothetical protein